MNRIKLIGPPGTGKTTTLKQIVESALLDTEIQNEQLHPLLSNISVEDIKDIAFITFTNTAVYTAAERLGIKAKSKEAPLFRTTPGLAAHLLIKNKLLQNNQVPSPFKINLHKYRFCQKHGIPYSFNEFEPVKGNLLFNEYSKLIHTNYIKTQDVYEAIKDSENVTLFRAWINYKRKHEMIDFEDLLILGYDKADDIKEHVSLLIVDEAQDLSPLEFGLLDKIISRRYEIIAGDPLQSIYIFKGAKPTLFTKRQGKAVTLSQSYRIPELSYLLAQGIALEILKKPLKYKPKQKRGEIKKYVNLDDALKEAIGDARAGKKVFILARTNSIVRKLTLKLAKDYKVIIGHLKANIATRRVITAVKAVEILQKATRREKLTKNDYKTLAKAFNDKTIEAGLSDVIMHSLLKDLRNVIKYLTKDFTDNELEIFKILLYRQNLEDLSDRLFVDTFHASKGEEADSVVIINSVSKSTKKLLLENFEAEKLSFYVAITRVREKLIFTYLKRDNPRQTNYTELIEHVSAYAKKFITYVNSLN